MNENNWCTCAEFNAKTEANYRKRREQRIARRTAIKQRRTATIRRHNKLVALDMTLIGVICAALGVLVGWAF